MTNLEWIVKQNLKTVVKEALKTAKETAETPSAFLEENDWHKLIALNWLFTERKEEECTTLKKSEQEQTKN